MIYDSNSDKPLPIEETDGELEHLLRDAYDAPVLPSSLLLRLDHLIAEEWGQSPGLFVRPDSGLQRLMSAGRRSFNLVRAAGCVAVVVVAVLMFGRGSPAYAWSSMIQALEKQGIVQLDGPGVRRWLSLSDGLLSERADSKLTLLDTRQDVVLERSVDEVQVRRRKLSGDLTRLDRDHLVLAFLLGNATSKEATDRLRGARLIHEQFKNISVGKHKSVSLTIRWETDQFERFEIQLTLDPTTHLPLASGLAGERESPSTALSWSYPSVGADKLRAADFPANYAVVDVDARGIPLVAGTAIAAKESSSSGGTGNSKSTPSDSGSSSTPEIRLADASAVIGAASGWKPVEITSRTRQEVVLGIDSLLEDVWRANDVEPAPPADDEELLRRVFLDLGGRTPTIHEIRSYLGDKSPDRYERLVDRLLENRDHASHLATIWRSFLIPEGVDLTAFGGVEAFDRWLAERFGKNDPYDSVVRNLLLAEGRLSRSGPLLFYSAAKLDPDLLAARSARVFLGMRLECAQCHNHPFEPWTQEEFWGFAAFFAQISRPQGELQAVSTVMQVRDVDHGEVKLPKTELIIPPHFLDGRPIQQPDGKPGSLQDSRRQLLAQWLTAAENPYFSRAGANRVWSIMFGKGIVDPVDDFGIRHQPKSPQLLELLAGHFANTKFDLRDLFRTIALSRAYRLSSGAAIADPKRNEWFAQMNVKTFSAEQVYDCITVATMIDVNSTIDPFAFNIARAGNSSREMFLQQFRTPTGRSTEYLGGIPQALTLMNGNLIDNATGLTSSGLLKSLEAPFFTNKQRVEVLYLAALSRYPRPSEWRLLNEYINDKTSGKELWQSLSDILWALLNSAEFTMNH